MSSKASAWSGVFPAVTTQFSKDGALHLDGDPEGSGRADQGRASMA